MDSGRKPETLFSPLRIGTTDLKNRTVLPPVVVVKATPAQFYAKVGKKKGRSGAKRQRAKTPGVSS